MRESSDVGTGPIQTAPSRPLLASREGLESAHYHDGRGPNGGGHTQSILGYQGDITDAVTAQVDMGTRWYAPGTGRFISRDVVFGQSSSPMTLNQYAYGGMNPTTMIDPTGMGQCTMAGECQDKHGNAVGGNPGASDSPYSDCYSCVFSPPPPPPAPIIEYVPRPFTSPEERAGDIDRYHRWVDHNPSVRVDRVGPGWDVSEVATSGADLGANGGCGLLRWRCLGDAFAFLLNLPITGTAVLVAMATGHGCKFEARMQVGCYGNDQTGNSHAVTWGGMFVTDNPAGLVSDDERAHEYRHSRQWLLPGFPVMYGANWLVSRGVSGDQCLNLFEMQAGFADGGYDCG